jgi:hypothetical protein
MLEEGKVSFETVPQVLVAMVVGEEDTGHASPPNESGRPHPESGADASPTLLQVGAMISRAMNAPEGLLAALRLTHLVGREDGGLEALAAVEAAVSKSVGHGFSRPVHRSYLDSAERIPLS